MNCPNKIEKENKKLFRKTANNYITEIASKDRIDFSGYIGAKREYKVSTVIALSRNFFIPINYITGSNVNTFSNSIYKSNTIFSMIEKSPYNNNYSQKVAFVNNISEGYIPEKVNHILLHMQENTNTNIIKWSEKNKLQGILNQK